MNTDNSAQYSWLRHLHPDPALPITEPLSDPELVQTVLEELGRDAVAWATQVGEQASEYIASRIPAFANDTGLKRGTESITLSALLRMTERHADIPVITDDARRNIRDSTATAVTLEEFLSGVHLGHASMSEAFLAACETLSPPESRASAIRLVSARLFEHMDKFAVAATNIFEAEQAHLSATPAAVRAATVRNLLSRSQSGLNLDAEELDAIQRRLNYSLRQVHVAIVLSRSRVQSSEPPDVLRRLGYQIARASGAHQSLVHTEGTETWVWLGGDDENVQFALEAISLAGCVASVGTAVLGPTGFHRSLEEAFQVRDLRRRSNQAPTVWHYSTVELALLASIDFVRATNLVTTRLRGLLGESRQDVELRDTLRVYLDSHLSPNEAAGRLHVTRNTVSSRVHKASERLGRSPTGDVLDLHLALTLVNVYGISAFINHRTASS
ncbi:hypothetical protein XU06_30360 (plasmid) [Rhodococcus erythropolis]|uniref:PucR family transcriptional regulator n=1 Tax=Rhodococcus erythropolis TaxID=1833 RepID=UPI00061B5FE5|nr:helix-turn-helix domain-containing protein [Rhodococcus erythropolis]AKE01230.1 hypothetical protein XU06_30360 [Rhodococcus erythropolis]